MTALPFAHMAVTQTALALLAVLLLVGALGVLARRFNLTPRARLAPDSIRLRGILALDARRRLYLVETDFQHALILAGGASDAILPLVGSLPAAQPASYRTALNPSAQASSQTSGPPPVRMSGQTLGERAPQTPPGRPPTAPPPTAPPPTAPPEAGLA